MKRPRTVFGGKKNMNRAADAKCLSAADFYDKILHYGAKGAVMAEKIKLTDICGKIGRFWLIFFFSTVLRRAPADTLR